MTFRFFGARRAPHPAASPDSTEDKDVLGADRASRKGTEPKGMDDSVPMPIGPGQAPAPLCFVERACAAFHAAQKSIVTLTEGRDEMDAKGLPELCAQRDAAFKQVRSHSARTRSAYQAKVHVLIVMRDWFAVEDPHVSAFGIELAVEAAALFDKDRDQSCTSQMRQGEVLGRHWRGAERRK